MYNLQARQSVHDLSASSMSTTSTTSSNFRPSTKAPKYTDAERREIINRQQTWFAKQIKADTAKAERELVKEHELRGQQQKPKEQPQQPRSTLRSTSSYRNIRAPTIANSRQRQEDLSWLRGASKQFGTFCSEWREAMSYAEAIVDRMRKSEQYYGGESILQSAQQSVTSTSEFLRTLSVAFAHHDPTKVSTRPLMQGDAGVWKCQNALVGAWEAWRKLHGFQYLVSRNIPKPADTLPTTWYALAESKSQSIRSEEARKKSLLQPCAHAQQSTATLRPASPNQSDKIKITTAITVNFSESRASLLAHDQHAEQPAWNSVSSERSRPAVHTDQASGSRKSLRWLWRKNPLTPLFHRRQTGNNRSKKHDRAPPEMPDTTKPQASIPIHKRNPRVSGVRSGNFMKTMW